MLEFEILLIFPLFTSFFFFLSLNLLALIIMASVVVVAYLLNLFDAGSAIVIRRVIGWDGRARSLGRGVL